MTRPTTVPGAWVAGGALILGTACSEEAGPGVSRSADAAVARSDMSTGGVRWDGGSGAPDAGSEDTAVAQDPRPALRFEASFLAGSTDANGSFMGGTETMRLAGYGGALFAGNGYWTDVPGEDPTPGAQVLTKPGPEVGWRVERNFPGALRVNAMEPMTLSTNGAGVELADPVELLLVDAARESARASGRLRVWVRNSAGEWTESAISNASGLAYVRAFGFHRDTATGADLVFAGTGAGEIFRGQYDAEAAGGIRWNPEPEYRNPAFDGSTPFARVSAFGRANGRLYASVSPRILVRSDGTEPTWTEVLSWNDPMDSPGAGVRGLTGVPGPDGTHEVLLGARERDGEIWRIDPMDDHARTVELDGRRLLQGLWPDGLLAGRLLAYNRFISGSHPLTGRPIHWVTSVAVKNDDPNAAWLLVRHQDGSYEPVRVYDDALQDHPLLVSTRTIEAAPWDPLELYTGGYDGAANDRMNHNTAWIFRGRVHRTCTAGEPGEHHLSLTHAGRRREYLVYIPEFTPVPAPLVIVLHGGGGAGNLSLLERTGMREKADEEGFVLVAPSGIEGLWNAGACCGDPEVDDVGFIVAMLDDLETRRCFDRKRVYVTGHSNGGMMAYRLACEASDRVAAVAASAGYLLNQDPGTVDAPIDPPTPLFSCEPDRPVPVLSVHGTEDTCAPIAGGPVSCGGRRLRLPVAHGLDTFRTLNGCTGGPSVSFEQGDARCMSWGPCAGGSDVVYCTVEGGGHCWFGNPRGTNPDRFGGRYSDDLIMQDAAWEFFETHPMPVD
jgi:polyhydroxybutyrate depolymerase